MPLIKVAVHYQLRPFPVRIGKTPFLGGVFGEVMD